MWLQAIHISSPCHTRRSCRIDVGESIKTPGRNRAFLAAQLAIALVYQPELWLECQSWHSHLSTRFLHRHREISDRCPREDSRRRYNCCKRPCRTLQPLAGSGRFWLPQPIVCLRSQLCQAPLWLAPLVWRSACLWLLPVFQFQHRSNCFY